MLATELQLNHSVELEVTINGKTTTFLSSIKKISNNTVLLSPILINEKLVIFPPEYAISFIYGESDVLFYWKDISLKAVKHKNQIYYYVTLDGKPEIWNRRNSFRIYIGEYMELISFGKEGPKTHNVFIKDISQTGMAFISSEPFFVKHTVRLKLKLFSGQFIHLNAQIVRTQPTNNETEILYGCRFVEKSPLLSKHLMKLQQEQQK